MTVWQIQEAKAKLSEFVNEAKHKPQIISRHGKPEIIAMSIEQYEKLLHDHSDLVSFFRNSPIYDVDLNIERDKSPDRKIQFL